MFSSGNPFRNVHNTPFPGKNHLKLELDSLHCCAVMKELRKTFITPAAKSHTLTALCR